MFKVTVCFCVFREEFKVKGHIEDKQLQYVGWSSSGSAMVSVSPTSTKDPICIHCVLKPLTAKTVICPDITVLVGWA